MKIKKNGKVIKLTESDLQRIVKRVLNEQTEGGEVTFPNVKTIVDGITDVSQTMIDSPAFEGQFIGEPDGTSRDGEGGELPKQIRNSLSKVSSKNLGKDYYDMMIKDQQEVFGGKKPTDLELYAYYSTIPEYTQNEKFGEVLFPNFDMADVYQRDYWKLTDEQNDRYDKKGGNIIRPKSRQYDINEFGKLLSNQANMYQSSMNQRIQDEQNPVGKLPTRPLTPMMAKGGEGQKVFGGTFNGKEYAWDFTDAKGDVGYIWANPSPLKGKIISVGYDWFMKNREYEMLTKNNDSNAPKENSPGVGFQSENGDTTFLCYVGIDNNPYCVSMS
jgi:hypothetical protein